MTFLCICVWMFFKRETYPHFKGSNISSSFTFDLYFIQASQLFLILSLISFTCVASVLAGNKVFELYTSGSISLVKALSRIPRVLQRNPEPMVGLPTATDVSVVCSPVCSCVLGESVPEQSKSLRLSQSTSRPYPLARKCCSLTFISLSSHLKAMSTVKPWVFDLTPNPFPPSVSDR